jgi:hypothetical protein
MRSQDLLVQAAQAAEETTRPEIRLLKLADLRQAVDAAIVAALGEVDNAPGSILAAGAVDGAQWLASRSEIHPAEANALAGLARALPDMPATGDAVDGGKIGTEKARLLSTARTVDGFEQAEAGLVEQLVGVTLRTARRVVGRFIADHRDPAPADPAANEVSLSPKRNGRWQLRGDLDVETARVIANELRRLADGHRDDDESSTTARRTALALLDMARRSVTLGERGAGSRPELVLVADLGVYGDLYDLRHEDGTPVGRQVFESLACDATVRGMVANGPSDPLDLGRSQRLASPGQRRAAAIRDGGCVYPGCDRQPEDCDLHHIRHWLEHQGSTDLANLCRRHHTLTHAIGFTFVRHRDGRLTIHRPDGTPLRWPGEPAPDGPLDSSSAEAVGA